MEIDVSHLHSYSEEEAYGPIQREEALLLFAFARVIRPRVIVEFGFASGHSAYNFAHACTADIYSYDPDPFIERPGHGVTLIRKRQEDFDAEDIGSRDIDICFFDASHSYDANLTTFKRLGALINRGTIIVHDTGTWARRHMREVHLAHPGPWINDQEKAHRPDERRFVNYLCQNGWTALHAHSLECVRHGLTFLQRVRLLP